MPRAVPLAINLALAVASFGLTLGVLELFLFPHGLRYLPLRLHPELREPALRSLAQSSKRTTWPRDYVALVGDSYAAGDGDWFRSVDHDRNPPFHSAHLIQQATGRDVISLAHPGAGSMRALVSEPLGRLAYLDRTWRLGIEAPSDLLLYFYAGNDLEDNVEDLRRRHTPERGPELLRDQADFADFLQTRVLEQSFSWREAQSFSGAKNFFVSRNLRYLATRRLEERAAKEPPTQEEQPAQAEQRAKAKARRAGRKNQLHTGEGVKKLLRPMLAPGIVLTEEELDDALYVFRESARFLAARLPEARITVVYVPSPAESYRHAQDEAWVFAVFFRDRDGEYPVSAIHARGDEVCTSVASFAAEEGMEFVDARPFVREAAEAGPVHGPTDWRHFNRAGYEALADAAVAGLESAAPAHCAGWPETG